MLSVHLLLMRLDPSFSNCKRNNNHYSYTHLSWQVTWLSAPIINRAWHKLNYKRVCETLRTTLSFPCTDLSIVDEDGN